MQGCFSLFFVFSKIGLFTLGGGYAMLPLMEREMVDKRAWISRAEFLDLTAVAQAAPGIFAVNMAIFTGYKLRGFWGSVCAALGAVVPSFIIILLIAVFFQNYQNNPVVVRIFKGVRPAVVALIAVPVLRLAKAANISYKTVWIPVVCALMVWAGKVSPVYVILLAGLGGWLCFGRKEAQ